MSSLPPSRGQIAQADTRALEVYSSFDTASCLFPRSPSAIRQTELGIKLPNRLSTMREAKLASLLRLLRGDSVGWVKCNFGETASFQSPKLTEGPWNTTVHSTRGGTMAGKGMASPRSYYMCNPIVQGHVVVCLLTI